MTIDEWFEREMSKKKPFDIKDYVSKYPEILTYDWIQEFNEVNRKWDKPEEVRKKASTEASSPHPPPIPAKKLLSAFAESLKRPEIVALYTPQITGVEDFTPQQYETWLWHNEYLKMKYDHMHMNRITFLMRGYNKGNYSGPDDTAVLEYLKAQIWVDSSELEAGS